MKARFLFVLAGLSASVLVACGGGGGGSSTPATVAPSATPTAVATATLSPSPAPTLPANYNGCYSTPTPALATRTAALVGVQPITAGNSFSYTGSLQQTTVRSSPCPEPTVSASAAVTVQVTVTTSPGAASGTFDEHTVETDNFTTNSTQTTTDAAVTNASGMLKESAETSADLSGNTTTTTYGTLGLTYGYTSPLGGTITNTPPSTVNQTLTDGSTFDRTYNGSTGAYTESDTAPGVSTPSTITVNANGSASYTLSSLTSKGALLTITASFAAPVGGYIAANLDGNTYNFKDWIPSGPLYSDTLTDKGTQALPSACGTSVVSGTIDETLRTLTQVDPALGTLETRTTASYNVNNGTAWVGPVCVVINDSEKLFYDYLLDTNYTVYATQNGLPFQTVTLTETYSLSSSPTLNAVRRDMTTSALQSAAGNLASVVAAHEAGISFAHSVERAQRSETFMKALRAQAALKAVRPLGGAR